MNFMLIDDDETIRIMLQDIIEDEDLGIIIDSRSSAEDLSVEMLQLKKIDILIIDFLMPGRDGIDAVKALKGFNGRIIMLSQAEDKDIIAKAYKAGISSYISKPLNRIEVTSVIRDNIENLKLRAFAEGIQTSLQRTFSNSHALPMSESPHQVYVMCKRGSVILHDMGIHAETGSRDILAILDVLDEANAASLPSLKQLFAQVAAKRGLPEDKESKAIEQRIRWAIFQAMTNIANMGIVDFASPSFGEYSMHYFDPAEIRSLMNDLEQGIRPQISRCHINTKKFLLALLMECQQK